MAEASPGENPIENPSFPASSPPPDLFVDIPSVHGPALPDDGPYQIYDDFTGVASMGRREVPAWLDWDTGLREARETPETDWEDGVLQADNSGDPKEELLTGFDPRYAEESCRECSLCKSRL